jgi:hypothetical protein
MKARFRRFAASTRRATPVWTTSLFLTLFAAGSAHAIGTPEQRKACTPDVYRLCAGESPTSAPSRPVSGGRGAA